MLYSGDLTLSCDKKEASRKHDGIEGAVDELADIVVLTGAGNVYVVVVTVGTAGASFVVTLLPCPRIGRLALLC